MLGKIRILAFGLCALWTLPCLAASLPKFEFRLNGKLIASHTIEGLEKISPAQIVAVDEIHEKRKVSFKGFPLAPLIQKIYGKKWNRGDGILLKCADGYEPSVSKEIFAKPGGFLAYERVGYKYFTARDKLRDNKVIPLGPYYLVWNEGMNPGIKVESDSIWSYAVLSMDLIQFEKRFPKLAPPAKASARAKKGFLAFKRHCLSCHSINGQGGKKGPELNRPVNATEKLKDSWMVKWIEDPLSLSPNVAMTPLKLHIKDPKKRRDTTFLIISYLKAMAKKKLK